MAGRKEAVSGWPGYFVTDGGIVTGPRGKVLRLNPCIHNRVTLYGRNPPRRQSISPGRLVLETFIGPCPDGKECCHRDDDTTNNHISNVYWGTYSENMMDREINDKANHQVGEDHGRSVLTEAQVYEIRALRLADPKYWSYRRLGRRFCVTHPNIIYVLRGDTWSHVR